MHEWLHAQWCYGAAHRAAQHPRRQWAGAQLGAAGGQRGAHIVFFTSPPTVACTSGRTGLPKAKAIVPGPQAHTGSAAAYRRRGMHTLLHSRRSAPPARTQGEHHVEGLVLTVLVDGE